jgi:FKBP-type peptidyl-prolyl cis-trans isomerase
MRRRRAAALAFISLLATVAVAGCGSATSSGSAGSTGSATSSGSASATASGSATPDTYTSVTATGKFGAAPTLTIPAVQGSGPLYTKTVIQGTGPALTTADSLLGNFVLYDWSGSTHKLIGSTYTSGTPTLFTGQLLPGLETALIGQKAGSRVLAVIPPADAFGSAGNSRIGVKATDTVIFVVDMVQSIPNTETVPGKQTSNGGGVLPSVTPETGKAPVITIPSSVPPKTLQVKTLVTGTGAVVKKGQSVVVQYTGVNWRTKKTFDASWLHGSPFQTPIGVGQVISGWDKGLVGQPVGSRVLLIIPPADGYGKSGSAQAGIKGTDTLVFVVDILATS